MMEISKAEKIASYWLRKLRPFCDKIEIAGSIRRQKQLVKDIELVCIPKTTDRQTSLFGGVDRTRVAGFANALEDDDETVIKKGDPRNGKYIQIYLHRHQINMDVFCAVPNNWGYIYAIRTGPAEFSEKVLAWGWKRNGYHGQDGFLRNADEEIIAVPDEKTMFHLAGVQYLEPWRRA
jgi:DNA polymerase/3'-5' exonuclease PolX